MAVMIIWCNTVSLCEEPCTKVCASGNIEGLLAHRDGKLLEMPYKVANPEQELTIGEAAFIQTFGSWGF